MPIQVQIITAFMILRERAAAAARHVRDDRGELTGSVILLAALAVAAAAVAVVIIAKIHSNANQVPGRLDLPPFAPNGTASSFFDVFVELHVGGQTLHPATPLHMASTIRNKPPRPGDQYNNPFTQPVPLLDANGNPTGIYVLNEVHTPNPTNPPPDPWTIQPTTRLRFLRSSTEPSRSLSHPWRATAPGCHAGRAS